MEKQLELKDKLIRNVISKKEFLDLLLDLDQNTEDHEECLDNINILEEIEVKKLYIDSEDLYLKCSYYIYLRNFYFHAFQLLYDTKIPNVKNSYFHYLETADAISAIIENLDNSEVDTFTFYVRGTLCYMKSDINGLLDSINNLKPYSDQEGDAYNFQILERLYNGLINYKYPDYLRD